MTYESAQVDGVRDEVPGAKLIVAPRPSALALVPTAVLFVAVASFWALNTVAMRVAGRTVPPITVAAARALIGGLVLTMLARRRGAAWPTTRSQWFQIAAIAVPMTGLSTVFLFLAARNIPAGLVSILSNTMPLFVAVMATVVLGERVTSRIALGLGIGMLGAVIVAWRAIEGQVRGIGILYGVLAAVTSAIGSVMYKRFPLPGVDRLMAVAMQLLISCALVAVIAIPDDRSTMSFPKTFIVSFVYLSLFGLALSFVCFSELVSRGTGMQASAVAYLSTVLGVCFGALLLHERLSWSVLVGGIIAICGVALVQFGNNRP